MSVNIRTTRILGVKYSKSKAEITIGYQKFNDVSHSWDDLALTSKETPVPEFVDALSALSESVCSICAFPYDWAKEIAVTGFRRKLDAHDNVSVLINSYRTLPVGGNLTINTPLTAIKEDEDSGALSMPLARLQELIDAAVTEAVGFLDGKRGQMSLDLDGKGGASPEPDEVPGEGFHDIDPAKPAKPKKRKPARTAKGKGEQAHEDNKDMSHNPFDPKSEYDAYTSWNLGWQEADERARREVAAEAPDAEGEPNFVPLDDAGNPIE